jgi:hypothetical protein
MIKKKPISTENDRKQAWMIIVLLPLMLTTGYFWKPINPGLLESDLFNTRLSANRIPLLKPERITMQKLGDQIGWESGEESLSTDPYDEVRVLFVPLVTTQDITKLRPYTNSSAWNTPIGPNPIYDPHSDEMVATIGLDSEGRITSNTENYSYTLYYADQSTPRWDVPCASGSCTIVKPDETIKTPILKDVPIPPNAQPAGGSDAPMIIVDKGTFAEYNLRGVVRTSTGWTIKNGSVYNILWDGAPTRYGSRGAGVPYFAGLIRPWEIEGGHIQHAIGFAYPFPAIDQCVFPASKTDGDSTLPYAIPEGARLQLDPSLTENDFDQMGLDRAGKIIAQALQEYGMILVNVSGRPKIFVENLDDNPYATVQWSDPGLNLTNTSIVAIPYTYFRVLKLPDAYWTTEIEPTNHGRCYK